MERIIQLRKERTEVTKELRNIVDTISLEKRDFTDVENVKTVELDKRLKSLDNMIALEENLIAREGNIAEVGIANIEVKSAPESKVDLEKEVRSFLTKSNYEVKPEVRELITDVDGLVGIKAPQTWETSFWNKLQESDPIRPLATVMNISSSAVNIPMPGVVNPFERIAEGGTYPVLNNTIGTKTLKRKKAGGIILTTMEALNSGISVEQELMRQGAVGVNDLMSVEFVSGTSNSDTVAQGILNGGTSALTSASATSISYDEVITLNDSLKAGYQKKAKYMCNGATRTALRALKDADNNYLYDKVTDTILGREVIINDNMPDIATGNKALVFGDFSQYLICDRAGIEIVPMLTQYVAQGKVGYRFTIYSDAQVMDAEAIKFITQL